MNEVRTEIENFTNLIFYNSLKIIIRNNTIHYGTLQYEVVPNIIYHFLNNHNLYIISNDGRIIVLNLRDFQLNHIGESLGMNIKHAYRYLDNLYVINHLGKIFKSTIYDLQFTKLELCEFEDRYDSTNTPNYNLSFELFVAALISQENDRMVIADSFGRVYKFTSECELLYFHTSDFVSLYIKNSNVYSLSKDGMFIKFDGQKNEKMIKNSIRIIDDNIIMCKTSIYYIQNDIYDDFGEDIDDVALHNNVYHVLIGNRCKQISL
ncbi:hypothetical protein COBT_002047 [Conglomerata obtusa]